MITLSIAELREIANPEFPPGASHDRLFSRWLVLFKQTVDEHFAGPKAVEAKNVAASIADTFQNRMQLLR